MQKYTTVAVIIVFYSKSSTCSLYFIFIFHTNDYNFTLLKDTKVYILYLKWIVLL